MELIGSRSLTQGCLSRHDHSRQLRLVLRLESRMEKMGARSRSTLLRWFESLSIWLPRCTVTMFPRPTKMVRKHRLLTAAAPPQKKTADHRLPKTALATGAKNAPKKAKAVSISNYRGVTVKESTSEEVLSRLFMMQLLGFLVLICGDSFRRGFFVGTLQNQLL